MKKIAVAAVMLMMAVFVLFGVTGASGAQSSLGWCGEPENVVVLGDSTATGYGATGYPDDHPGYAPTRYGWGSQMMTWLSDERGVATWNYAMNGALVSDFLPEGQGIDPRPSGNFRPQTVQEVEDMQPELIVISLGANEYGSGRSTDVYEQNLEILLDLLQDAAPDADFLFGHTYEFLYRWPGNGQDWSEYGATMSGMAEVRGSWFLDMTEFMPTAVNGTAGLYIPDEYGSLSVHTNDSGHVAQYATYLGKVRSLCS